MSYELTIKETYKGGPDYAEKMNFSTVDNFDRLDTLKVKVIESIEGIHDQYIVLREWDEVKDGCVKRNVLFKRKNGKPGRLIRRHIITEKRPQKWDDSLI